MTPKHIADAIVRGFLWALIFVTIGAVTLALGGVTFSHH